MNTEGIMIRTSVDARQVLSDHYLTIETFDKVWVLRDHKHRVVETLSEELTADEALLEFARLTKKKLAKEKVDRLNKKALKLHGEYLTELKKEFGEDQYGAAKLDSRALSTARLEALAGAEMTAWQKFEDACFEYDDTYLLP